MQPVTPMPLASSTWMVQVPEGLVPTPLGERNASSCARATRPVSQW